jgi:hypothetical protein
MKALYKRYCPRDVALTVSLLRATRCLYAENMSTFNKYKYFQYVQRFLSIMNVCSERCPPVRVHQTVAESHTAR